MNPDQKEELRRLCLGYLCKRSAAAFNDVSIHTGVSRDMKCTIDEVEEATLFLKSAGFLEEIPNGLGSRRYYQPTANGILAYERGI